jgi:hypothetical protein
VRKLTAAVVRRDASLTAATAVLEPLEHAAHPRDEGDLPELSAPDIAHLLAVVRGAKLHQNLVTQRLSVMTASGSRMPYPALKRLEEAGVVQVDRAHPLHAGQPVTLTGLGRRALTGQPAVPGGRPPVRSSAAASSRR